MEGRIGTDTGVQGPLVLLGTGVQANGHQQTHNETFRPLGTSHPYSRRTDLAGIDTGDRCHPSCHELWRYVSGIADQGDRWTRTLLHGHFYWQIRRSL